jgi:hypothetical protein
LKKKKLHFFNAKFKKRWKSCQKSGKTVKGTPDQPGLVQGLRDLRGVLSEDGAGAGRAGQGRGGSVRRLHCLPAVRTALPGPGD